MKTEQKVIAFPNYIADVTGVESVRIGARFVWITTVASVYPGHHTGLNARVVRVARRYVRTPDAPSAFDLADIIARVAA